MRLNLIVNQANYLQDYINICPYAEFEDNNVVYGDFNDLSMFVDDGEADEVRAISVLECFAFTDLSKLLDQWIKKVKLGGLLTVGGTELTLICKAAVNRELTFEDVVKYLYGNSIHERKLCTLNSLYLRGLLEQKKLQIKLHRITNYNFVVQAERNQL